MWQALREFWTASSIIQDAFNNPTPQTKRGTRLRR